MKNVSVEVHHFRLSRREVVGQDLPRWPRGKASASKVGDMELIPRFIC